MARPDLGCCVHIMSAHLAPLSEFSFLSSSRCHRLHPSVSLHLSLSPFSCSPSVFPLLLSAVSPLISPVESPGAHMPSVCRASGDASCAGVPQSTHNRCGGHGERASFGLQVGLGVMSMMMRVGRVNMTGMATKARAGSTGYGSDGNCGGEAGGCECGGQSAR